MNGDEYLNLEPHDPIYVLKNGEFVFLGELDQICFKLDGKVDLSILPAAGYGMF